MNPRLIAYLRSVGLKADATDKEAWTFFRGLRGVESSIANVLNYEENDAAARTNCDLLLRALGVNPENPSETVSPPTPDAGTDGASSLGDLESARSEGQQLALEKVKRVNELIQIAGIPSERASELATECLALSEEEARELILKEHRALTRNSVPPELPGRAPAQHTRGEDTTDTIVAAFMMRAGVADPTQQWCEMRGDKPVRVEKVDSSEDPDVYRAVDRAHELSGLSLVNLCQRALATQGVQATPSVEGIIDGTRSLASSGDFVGIFTQTFGAILLQAFQEFPDTSTVWTVERDNPNFMANERTRLKKGGELTRHARGGTADHMDFSDITETVKVNRYSGQFVVDEIDLQNDYFGALAGQTPQEIGRAAARIRPDLVYSLLFANPALASGTNLFDASHNNLHGTNALDMDGLKAALAAMQLQQENGVNLNLAGRYILVPPSLYWTAREVLNSPLKITGSDVVLPNANALTAENITIVSEARLENGVVDPATQTAHAGSATDWYLAAAPGSGHTVEVTYLAGSARAPMMRSFVLDRGQWGIGWDVKHDIGAAPLAYQGISKSTAT